MPYNFKSIADVEVVAEPSESASVLIEENGVIKKAPKTSVGGGGKRELVYEWNFEADENPENGVGILMENVYDDLSWLTTVSYDYGWEIECEQYGLWEYNDESGNQIIVVEPEIYTTLIVTDKATGCVRFQNDTNFNAYCYGDPPEDYLNGWEKQYFDVCAYIGVYNKVHVDSDGVPTTVNSGGLIRVDTDGRPSLKSVKIYKVHR